jgi:outer membrane protein OmpA-like peptidoglycan-associated protein
MFKVFRLYGFILLLPILIGFNAQAQKSPKELKADRYYNVFSFKKAIEKYVEISNLSPEGKRKLAECYCNISDYKNCETAYLQLINTGNTKPEDFFRYASVLRLNGNYDESDKWMKKFNELAPDDSRGKSFVKDSPLIYNLLKDEGRYRLTHPEMNSDEQDFGPAFYNERVVFASSKSGTKSVKRTYNRNDKGFLNLYVADVNNFQLINPKELPKTFNRKMHDGPASFTRDGKLMAFTRNNYSGKSSDGTIKLQIFFSEKSKGDRWTKETPFKLNNAEYSVGHPCLSADGKTMYFASDLPGGFGGVDLYRISKNEDGSWGEAENLGPEINTKGNEMFPFFHEGENFLFFAGDGHMGLGGLDLFISPLSKTGKFAKPLNLGTPVNTRFDDFSLVMDKNMKFGFFASNRAEGKGDDDIYAFEILKPFTFQKIIKGIAMDKEMEILAGTTVNLYDSEGNIISSVVADAKGKYEFIVDPDKDFKLDGKFEGYFDGNNTASTKTDKPEIIANLVLEKDPGLSLLALITDAKSGLPISGVKMIITDSGKNKPFDSKSTDESGTYKKGLSDRKVGESLYFTVRIEKEGYLSKEFIFNHKINKPGEIKMHEIMNLKLEKLLVGADLATMIDIKPIYFDLGKYNIRKDAAFELDKIVKIMNEYPKMEIELGSHTDCRGSAASNEILSDNRAKASAEYIRTKIANPERITGKGYGEYKLKNGCECEGPVKSTCSETQHQENRRTEFIITKVQ